MAEENKYKKYSTENVRAYKNQWDKDFFTGVALIDFGEFFFISLGIYAFLCWSRGFQIAFIVILVFFYWFRIKYVEKKIIEAKQFLVLGMKFLNKSFEGRGITKEGARPLYMGHKSGFKDYINFLETQRDHLIARMVILNLFALVLLEIIRIQQP